MAEHSVENLNPALAIQQLLEQQLQQLAKGTNASAIETLFATLPHNVLASLAAGTGIADDGIEEPEMLDSNMINISANTLATLPEIKDFAFNGPKRLRIKDLPYEFSKLQEAAGREYFRCIGCRQRRDYLSTYWEEVISTPHKLLKKRAYPSQPLL